MPLCFGGRGNLSALSAVGGVDAAAAVDVEPPGVSDNRRCGGIRAASSGADGGIFT